MSKNTNVLDDIIITSNFGIKAQDVFTDLGCSDKYQIVYFTRGSGRFVVEGIEHKVREQAVLVVKPFSYSVACARQGELCGVSVCFTEAQMPQAVKNIMCDILGDELHSKLYSSFAVPELVFSAFEKLDCVEDIPEGVKAIYLEALICEVVSLLSISNAENREYNRDELGARVVKYLNRNIDKNISLDKLARRFFVSKYHLCRAFKSYSGTSVHAYINQKRILYAKQLIEAGESASAAAYKVGYGDYSAFYRAYKNIVGKSPVRE